MAIKAHCIYAFETLQATLLDGDPPSLSTVEELWDAFTARNARAASSSNDADSLSPSAKKNQTHLSPATIGTPSSSAATTPSGSSTPSKTSEGTSSSSLSSAPSDTSLPKRTALPPSPLFVTWNTHSRNEKILRGCIGTFAPQPIEQGLCEYARQSAFHDHRFRPIARKELPSLSAEVILLTDFEPASAPLDWTLGTHGIRIAFTDRGQRFGATYLPDVAKEQGWTKEETMHSLCRKAGWKGRDWTALGVEVVRYQGRKVGVEFVVWREWRAWCEERGLL